MSIPTTAEYRVLQGIAEELRAANVADLDADTVRWIVNAYRLRMFRDAGRRDLAEVRRRTAEHLMATRHS